MKRILLVILICNTSTLFAQSDPRELYETKLAELTEELRLKTKATYQNGPIFIFEKPYSAIVTKENDYIINGDTQGNRTSFNVGDSILIIGASPVTRMLRFKTKVADATYDTRAFERPGFDIGESEKFKEQVKLIKTVEWKEAGVIAEMLQCGLLKNQGLGDIEKHFIKFGDTSVFYQLRPERDRVHLYFDLRSYGGNDYKDVGISVGGESKLSVLFGDGSSHKFLCAQEGEDDRFARFDITDYSAQFLSGVEKITIALSKKTVSKELENVNKYAIGIKMQCFNL